jgi:hypothetical protein
MPFFHLRQLTRVDEIGNIPSALKEVNNIAKTIMFFCKELQSITKVKFLEANDRINDSTPGCSTLSSTREWRALLL